MTEPNVINYFGMKFLVGSDVKMINLLRPSVGQNFVSTEISLCTPNAESGTTYQVPVGKVFYLLSASVSIQGTTDLKLCIQKNTVADTSSTVTGDNMFNMLIEAEAGLQGVQIQCGGLQFDAADYVTPFDLNLAGSTKWGFNGMGVECDA